MCVYFKPFEFQRADPRILQTYPITSNELKLLFSNLELGIEDDPYQNSLVSSLLEEGNIQNLVSEINALSRGIELTKRNSNEDSPGAVCVLVTGFGEDAELPNYHEVNVFHFFTTNLKKKYL